MALSRSSPAWYLIIAVLMITVYILLTNSGPSFGGVRGLGASGLRNGNNDTTPQLKTSTDSTTKKQLQDQEALKAESPYAFVAFLQDHFKHEDNLNDDDDEYFLATRVLGYQLMHAPTTKSTVHIPFVVVCTPGVSKSKKARLARDGAIIADVDYVKNPDWIENNGPRERWRTMMTKLRIFQLLQYEKILFADSDVFITGNLDGIFQDDNSTVHTTQHELEATEDAGKVPKEYTFGGQAQQHGFEHAYPPDPEEPKFGAGFFLTKPSQELFDYYKHLLYAEPPRFDAFYMEQSLLNYAHRRDGPMPWKALFYKWTTSYPTVEDLEAGAKSMHHKFWWEETVGEENQVNKLTTMWYQVRGEMEGYYRARDEFANAAR